jgi:hypothetical protein
MFVVKKYDVDSSIPQWLDIYKGENSHMDK